MEKKRKITILNSAVLTNFGKFDYIERSIVEAKELINNGFESTVVHHTK